jgi:hypothetical protein
MSTDLNFIRNSLKGCEEITLPYKFPKKCWVKYITIKGEDEAFYEGGVYDGMGNQVVLLKNGKSRYRVPTYVRSDDGEILYRSRFFIDPTFKDDCEAKKGQLEKTVKAQQTVIERMAEQIKCLEESKQETQSEHYELVSLLHDKDDQIKSLLEKEKKYKLLLMKYMN